MPRPKAGQVGPFEAPKPDRFATHRHFVCVEVAKLTEATGSTSAGLALLIIWDWADGRSTKVTGLSVAKLAKTMRVSRMTARAALNAIKAAELLEVVTPGKVPVYRLAHLTKAEPVPTGQPLAGRSRSPANH